MHVLNCKLKNLVSLFLSLNVSCGMLSCKKKQQDENQNQETQVQISSEENNEAESSEDLEEKQLIQLFDFYSPALDKGDWVEEVLAQVEEERIAEELSFMEESLSEYQIEPENTEAVTETEEKSGEEQPSNEPELSPVEKFFNEEKSGTSIRGKNDELKFYELENEIFLPQYSDGKLINVHAEGNSVERLFYDENYHLVKKEAWNIPSVQAAVLDRTETYKYFDDSSIVSNKSIETKTTIEKISYSKTSKILSSDKYAVTEEKNKILSQRKIGYDAEDNLVSDSLTEYFYKDKDYKELDYSFEKKYVYTLNEDDIPPDFKYYENGVLKMLNKYTNEKGKYVSEIFFDENFSVKTYYENDIRVQYVFYNNGKVMRKKVEVENE